MRIDQSKYAFLLLDRHLRHSGHFDMSYMMTTLHIIQSVLTLSFIRHAVRSEKYRQIASEKLSMCAVMARIFNHCRLHLRKVYRYFHSGIHDVKINIPPEGDLLQKIS